MTMHDAIAALEAVSDFLREFGRTEEIYYTEDVAAPVYELTRRALTCNDPNEVRRILLQFEKIIEEENCYLPIQKAFLLWESGVISTEQLIVFLESAYRLSSMLRGKNEAARWTFHLLWRVTRPAR
jgi:hypothetical protein